MLDSLSQNILIRIFHARSVDKAEGKLLLGSNPRVFDAVNELIVLGVVNQLVQASTKPSKPAPAKSSPSSSSSEATLSLDPTFAKSLQRILEEPISDSIIEVFDISERLKDASKKWEYFILFILQYCEEIDKALLDPERSDPNSFVIQALEKANILHKVNFTVCVKFL
jgi:hypothetical protein